MSVHLLEQSATIICSLNNKQSDTPIAKSRKAVESQRSPFGLFLILNLNVIANESSHILRRYKIHNDIVQQNAKFKSRELYKSAKGEDRFCDPTGAIVILINSGMHKYFDPICMFYSLVGRRE